VTATEVLLEPEEEEEAKGGETTRGLNCATPTGDNCKTEL